MAWMIEKLGARDVTLVNRENYFIKMRVAANWAVHLLFPPDIVEVRYTRS